MSAIGTAKLKYNGLSGDNSWDAKKYTAVWLVWCDSADDGPIVVENAAGVPAYASHYAYGDEYDPYAFLKSKSSKKLGTTPDGRHIWECTCSYESLDPNGGGGNQDPCENPLEFSGDGEEYLSYPARDCDGNKYVNTAGEPHPAAVRATAKSYVIINITKNQLADPLPMAFKYQNTVNDAAFYGAAAGTLKLVKLRWTRQFKGQYAFWRVAFVFHYRPAEIDPNTGSAGDSKDAWCIWVMDEGEFYLDASDPPEKVHDNIKGHTTLKVYLDADGHKLATDGTKHWTKFRKFPPVNFNLLNL